MNYLNPDYHTKILNAGISGTCQHSRLKHTLIQNPFGNSSNATLVEIERVTNINTHSKEVSIPN